MFITDALRTGVVGKTRLDNEKRAISELQLIVRVLHRQSHRLDHHNDGFG